MMNVTFTSLEALILKATNECLAQPDPAAIEAFYTIMLDSTDGPQLAAQALATRIHAPNSREALLALSMIDRCMRKGDANFHAEIGKFRFLNEMIKLVSPKYLADRTTPEIRTRVLQLLHAWSIEYPKESKIKVAYDMLKNQGVIKETPPPLPPEKVSISSRPRIKSAIFEDEKKSKLLQKLLQSKKPEDLQHANRLIKTMVKEVSAALDSAGLLRDMLEHSSEASADEEQLIHELHTSCARLRPILQHLAAADSQAENLSDILNASDVLDEVFEKYNSFVIERKKSKNKKKCVTQPSSDSLLDFAGAVVNDQDQNTSNGTKDVVAIDELGDIFSNDNSLRSDVELLKPVNLFSHDDVNLIGVKPKVEGWNELDSLGEELLKKSLPKNIKRIDNFSNKQLVPQTSSTTAPIDDIMVDITDTNTSSVLNDQLNANDPLDKILDLGLPLQNIDTNSIPNKEIKVMSDNVSSVKVKNEMKPLTDINVTLDSVHPSKVSPLVAFEEEEGVTVVLHFCKDKPRTDVNVLVVSTTSKRTSAIEDYKFHAVVPKGCKVRLLTASSTSLPPFNPFLPPPALTQVMLIARPPAIKQINLKFVITYTCDDDVCSEMGEVTQLPLDDV
ncbi:unnamed protein product [Leptidea sinapis]|uniref:VHS domain-containing protein n=1 Tax=Leptidea sinapis TaxID=189913 RepID=A0A5E4QJS5_9NEOP|nr:unnamed protein product [Leptidea sinapis]